MKLLYHLSYDQEAQPHFQYTDCVTLVSMLDFCMYVLCLFIFVKSKSQRADNLINKIHKYKNRICQTECNLV